jgi:hypothetical protein
VSIELSTELATLQNDDDGRVVLPGLGMKSTYGVNAGVAFYDSSGCSEAGDEPVYLALDPSGALVATTF